MTSAKGPLGYTMTNGEHMAAWLVILVSAAVFFATAFSPADNFLKTIVILADLSFSGTLIARITRSEGWYGVVMLRSKKGLEAMDSLAKRFPKTVSEIADFGMSVSYGLPLAYYWYKRELKKLAVHALLVVLFYYWLSTLPASSGFLEMYTLPIGLLTGLLGLGVLSLLSSTISILTVKTAPSTVAPVVPGVTIPFWEGLIALGVVVAIHELSHGILARVAKIKIHSSGLLLAGPIPIGAFVEPDEKDLEKASIVHKRRILVAGTTSNFVFFLLFFAVLAGLSTLAPAMIAGVQVTAIHQNSTLYGVLPADSLISSIDGKPADAGAIVAAVIQGKPVDLDTANGAIKQVVLSQLLVSDVPKESPSYGIIPAGVVLDSIDGVKVVTTAQVRDQLDAKQPGALVKVSFRTADENGVSATVDKQVKLSGEKRMGVSLMQMPAFAYENKPRQEYAAIYSPVLFLMSIIGLIAFLSFALAVVNILPVFTTDGYRIAFEELRLVLGKKRIRLAARITLVASVFILLLLLINLARWFKFY